jgi:hypothetical protein
MITPEIEKALRDAFLDYGLDMAQYVFVEGSLEVTEYKMPDESDSPEELRGKNLLLSSAVFDHVSKPLAVGIEWSAIKETTAIFVGQMSFLTKGDPDAEDEDAVSHRVRA